MLTHVQRAMKKYFDLTFCHKTPKRRFEHFEATSTADNIAHDKLRTSTDDMNEEQIKISVSSSYWLSTRKRFCELSVRDRRCDAQCTR